MPMTESSQGKKEEEFMEREIELILNSTHDAIVVIGMDCKITIFNRAAETLVGVKQEDAIGKDVREIIQDTKLPMILESGIAELDRQQNIGNIKIITSRVPLRNEKGEIVGAMAMFRDITEMKALAAELFNQKEMQSMLAAIFNATQDAISVVDNKGLGVMVNPAYTRITGLTDKDIVGKPATADISEGESIHMKVISSGKLVKGALMRVGPMHKEVLVNAAPIIVDGELKGSVGVLHDITEISRLSAELRQVKEIVRKLEAKYTFEDIVGHDAQLMLAIEKAKRAAETPVTVLLRGESGTGKEIFAHAIHNSSERKYRQFIRVNCSALNENLLESELFGYDEGAFTGAKKGGKKGIFEEANGGTIFLDEIGELAASTQAKLLRVLQEKEFVRVGGTKSITVDVRVITATNADLEGAIKTGHFRGDLYYRLNAYPIKIPPLRSRKNDIYELSQFFVKKLNQQYGRNIQGISPEAVARMKKFNWPGNVRELENVIGRAIINMKNNEVAILEKHLPKFEKNNDYIDENEISEESLGFNLDMKLEDVTAISEKSFIQDVLSDRGGNKTETAKRLGISIRSLYYKMEKYEINE